MKLIKQFLRSLFFILAFSFLSCELFGQSLLPGSWQLNGSVSAIASDGFNTYIGGAFTEMGPISGPGAALDNSGFFNAAFPKVNDTIRCAVSDGSGGWYIGGHFTKVGDSLRNHLAHILNDGTVDSWNPDAHNTVNTLATDDTGNVYAGGLFTMVCGLSRNYIAKIRSTGTADTSWNPGADGEILSVAVNDSCNIFAGGRFSNLGGLSRNFIARINHDGIIDSSWNPGANAPVLTLAAADSGYLYAGGEFTVMGDSLRDYVARIYWNGTTDTSWIASADQPVYTVLTDNYRNCFIGGAFTAVNGESRSHLAKISAAGLLDAAWIPDADSAVVSLAIDNADNIYCAGKFITINGQSRKHLAKILSDGTTDIWDPNANRLVYTIAVDNTGLSYAGGVFSSVNNTGVHHIAKLQNDGTPDLSWIPDVEDDVYAIAIDGSGNVYAGGAFQNVNGSPCPHLVKFFSDGSQDISWNPGVNDTVYSLAADKDNNIFAGGEFTLAGGASRNHIAKILTDGAADATWNANADTSVLCMSLDNKNNLVIGGLFNSVDESAHHFIARLKPDGTAEAWNPGASNQVFAVVADSSGNVYAGGSFTNIGGENRNHIAKIKPDGLADAWNPDADADVKSLAVDQSGNIYAAGYFNNIGGKTRNHIARILKTGNADVWNPNADNDILSILLDNNDNVYAGGMFRHICNKFVPFMARIASQHPTMQSRNISVIPQDDKAAIHFLPGNGSKRLIFVAQATSDTIAIKDSISFYADSYFASGSQFESSGWYCVYNGSDSAMTIRGLASATQHRIAVFEYNSGPGEEKYLKGTDFRNPQNFKTKSSQYISFDPIPVKTYGDSAFVINAFSSSGLKLTFTSSDPGVAKITGDTLTIRGAGNSVITASQPGDSVFVPAVIVEQPISVNKADLTITADRITRKYGDPNPAFTKTYSGFKYNETAASITEPVISCSATILNNAGSYPIKLSGGTAINYNMNLINDSLIVEKADLTITADNKSRTYGDLNPMLTITYSGFKNGDSKTNIIEPSITCSAGPANNAGNYDIVLSGGSSINYNLGLVNGTMTVNKATLTITAENKTRLYGISNSLFTMVGTGFKNSDNLNSITKPVFSCIADSSFYVGNYDIELTGGLSVNYNLVLVKGQLTIQKTDLHIYANNIVRGYGDPNPVFSLSYGGFKLDDNAGDITEPSISCTADQSSNAGIYDITLSGGSAVNYTIFLHNGKITINKADLYAKVDNKTRKYGEANPVFTITYTGFRNSDNKSSITEPTLICPATIASNTGDYVIVASGGSAANYNITLTNGTLKVIKADLFLTADNKTRIYGDPDPVFTIKYSGFVNGEDSSKITIPTLFSTANTLSDAGIYDITLNGGSAANYNLITTKGTLTINKAELTVTADSKTRKYGQHNPALTLTYSGFKNADNKSSITEPGISCSIDSAANAGSYPIVLSGGAATNYNFTLKNGTLSVAKADLTYKADNKTRKYGEPNPAFTYTATGFVNGDDVSDITAPTISCTATAAGDARSYDIIFTGGSAVNYNFVLQKGTLTVEKIDLTVTVADTSRIYGEANPVFALKYAGFINGDTQLDITEPTPVTPAVKTSKVGEYDVTPGGGFSTNYNLILKKGKLQIKKATITITVDNKTRKENDPMPVYTVSITGFKNGEDESVIDVKPSCSCIADLKSPVGIYDILANGGSDDNYDFVLVIGKLTIIPGIGLDETITGTMIYPNPATDFVNILSAENNLDIRVHDMSGRTLIEEITSNRILNIQSLLPGTYLISINSKVFKLIKQ